MTLWWFLFFVGSYRKWHRNNAHQNSHDAINTLSLSSSPSSLFIFLFHSLCLGVGNFHPLNFLGTINQIKGFNDFDSDCLLFSIFISRFSLNLLRLSLNCLLLIYWVKEREIWNCVEEKVIIDRCFRWVSWIRFDYFLDVPFFIPAYIYRHISVCVNALDVINVKRIFVKLLFIEPSLWLLKRWDFVNF